MVVDIGGGCTEVAVLALGDVVSSHAIRIGSKDMDDAIVEYIRRKNDLLIGERTAETVKIKIGSAFPYDGESALSVSGRRLEDGLPGSAEISSPEVRDAIGEPLTKMVDLIRTTIETTPPELVGDILDTGIVLTGGGSMLRDLPKLIRQEVKIPVRVAENPQNCAIRGAGRCLTNRLPRENS